jgi:hypothetical protein
MFNRHERLVAGIMPSAVTIDSRRSVKIPWWHGFFPGGSEKAVAVAVCIVRFGIGCIPSRDERGADLTF